MHKSTLVTFLFILLSPCYLMAQLELDLGIKHKNEVFFQKNLAYEYFKRNWSVDISPSVGAEVGLSYGAVGVGLGFYYSILGFNKNNPDTANSLFVSRSMARTYFFDQVKYRATYTEIPLSIHYKFRFRKLTLKPGLIYSFHTLHRSYIHKARYYEYNINSQAEVAEAKEFLINGAKHRFNALMGFFEIEYNVAPFSFSYRFGIRKLEESYHSAIDDKPLSFSLTLGVQYYFISQYR